MNRIGEKECEVLRAEIRSEMSEKRYRHTLGVEKEAVFMARLYIPEETELLRAAALLHDLTKEYSDERQMSILRQNGEDMEKREKESPKIFHALTAAYEIPSRFPAFADERLLRAIRLHTTGDRDMDLRDMILYLADYIEEGRTYDDCVALRRYFYEGLEREEDKLLLLYGTLRKALQMTVDELTEDKRPISRETLAALEDINRKIKEKETMENTMASIDMGKKIAEILYRKKAKAITLLYVEKQTSITDYYVIATGNSRTQIGALRDEVDVKMSEAGVSPMSVEGRGNGTWELLDFGPVVVHIFSRDAREFYKLEKLWADAEVIDLEPIFAAVDKENELKAAAAANDAE